MANTIKLQFSTRSLFIVIATWAVVFASCSRLEQHTTVALIALFWFVFSAFAGGLGGLVVVQLLAKRNPGYLSSWMTASTGGIIGVALLWCVFWGIHPGAGDFRQPLLLLSSTGGFGLAGGTLAAVTSRLGIRVVNVQEPTAYRE